MDINIGQITLIISEEYLYLQKKLKYVLKSFEDVFQIDKALSISYGHEMEGDIHINPGNLNTFLSEKKDIPDYKMNKWMGKNIPILFLTELDENSLINKHENKIEIKGDILMSAFYFLSSWQEYISDAQDKIGRFPMEKSLLSKLDLIETPVVNYYFDILVKAIERIQSTQIQINSHHGNRLKIGISHDIDNCNTGSFQDSFRQFQAGQYWPAIKKSIRRLFGKDIWMNFDEWVALEKKYDVKSSYYFITEKTSKDAYPNADYDFQSKKMQSIVKQLKSNGHEIGIHGSINSGFKQGQLKNEISQFPTPVRGGRFHYLMMRVRESFSIIASSGLDYDSSLGFAEHIGFRNGFCFPYQPFNFDEDKPYEFYEFPFQMMDKTLIQPYYMGVNPSEASKKIQEMMNEISKYSGYFIFIWHNNTITGFKYKKWKPVLINTLEYGKKLNAEFLPLVSYHKRITRLMA